MLRSRKFQSLTSDLLLVLTRDNRVKYCATDDQPVFTGDPVGDIARSILTGVANKNNCYVAIIHSHDRTYFVDV